MNSKVKNILIPTVVLFAIAAIMAALLGVTNLITKDKIAERQALTEAEAVAKVIPADSYKSEKITYSEKEYSYSSALNNNEIIGYAFTVSSNGYGGTVTTVIGIDKDGKITGVEVSDVSSETPGLGQNAKNDSFKSQFIGKDSTVTVKKSGAGETEVNAVTGATITSTAVTSNVNTALELYKAVKGGDGNE